MSPAARHAVREAALWAATAAAVVLAMLHFETILAMVGGTPAGEHQAAPVPETDMAATERVVRLAADRRGHFAVDAHVNDRPVAFMADTGATLVTLTYDTARRLGLAPAAADFTHRTQTANGVARVAPLILERVRVGDIMVRDVRAIVAEPGRLSVNLLGMSFMGALRRVEMRGGNLLLVQ